MTYLIAELIKGLTFLDKADLAQGRDTFRQAQRINNPMVKNRHPSVPIQQALDSVGRYIAYLLRQLSAILAFTVLSNPLI